MLVLLTSLLNIKTRNLPIMLSPYFKQDSNEWKEARKKYAVTASVAPEIVGVGYKSPYKRWQIDRGLVPAQDDDPMLIQIQKQGQEDEPFVVDRFVHWFYERSNPVYTFQCGLFEHPVHNWLAASPDRRVWFPSVGQEQYILEVKTKQRGGDAELPTDNHYIQIQTQLACVPQASGAFFVSANCRDAHVDIPLVICTVTFDAELFNNLILPKLLTHLKNVSLGTPPPQKQAKKPTDIIYASKKAHVKVLWPADLSF